MWFSNYVGVATSMVKVVTNAFKAFSIKHGKKYTIKNWIFKGAVNQ